MRLCLQVVGGPAIPGMIEGRVHDDVIVNLVFKTCCDPGLAGQAHIRLEHIHAVRQKGVFGQSDASSGIIRHDRKFFDQQDVCPTKPRGDRETGRPCPGA
ncbi:hypothetical protein D3C86_1999600 [compost metagenome]